MTEAKLKTDAEERVPGFFPILMFTAVTSIILSFGISAYAGMGLAILTLAAAVMSLANASRNAWNWVIGMATCGFIIGFMALIMKMIIAL